MPLPKDRTALPVAISDAHLCRPAAGSRPVLDILLTYIRFVAMPTAKIFRHGGSQAVRLPKAFRFSGSEVLIEKHGDDVLLKPVPAKIFRSLAEIGRHLAETFPAAGEFPAPPPRPAKHERAAATF